MESQKLTKAHEVSTAVRADTGGQSATYRTWGGGARWLVVAGDPSKQFTLHPFGGVLS